MTAQGQDRLLRLDRSEWSVWVDRSGLRKAPQTSAVSNAVVDMSPMSWLVAWDRVPLKTLGIDAAVEAAESMPRGSGRQETGLNVSPDGSSFAQRAGPFAAL
jgi:hypothetical protein